MHNSFYLSFIIGFFLPFLANKLNEYYRIRRINKYKDNIYHYKNKDDIDLLVDNSIKSLAQDLANDPELKLFKSNIEAEINTLENLLDSYAKSKYNPEFMALYLFNTIKVRRIIRDYLS